MRGYGDQWPLSLRVRVRVRAVKVKRLELSTPNLVDIQCMAVARRGLSPGSKGQRWRSISRSRSYQVRCRRGYATRHAHTRLFCIVIVSSIRLLRSVYITHVISPHLIWSHLVWTEMGRSPGKLGRVRCEAIQIVWLLCPITPAFMQLRRSEVRWDEWWYTNTLIYMRWVKLEVHDADPDTDILADFLAMILARKSHVSDVRMYRSTCRASRCWCRCPCRHRGMLA